MNRRIFIRNTALLFCAPAIIKAENLMKVVKTKEGNYIKLPNKRVMGGLNDWIYYLDPTETPFIQAMGDNVIIHGTARHEWLMDTLT